MRTDQSRSGEWDASREIRFALNKTRRAVHVIQDASDFYKGSFRPFTNQSLSFP